MRKLLRNIAIIASITAIMSSVGCSKKNSEIILSEPMQNENAAVADSVIEEPVEKEDASDEEKSTESLEQEAPSNIMVHVCGAVLCEGVYELTAGSRVIDAVQSAGGFSEDADPSYVNQAQVLDDGVKLRIPTRTETAELSKTDEKSENVDEQTDAGITGGATKSVDQSDSSSVKVNLNTASEQELCTIPGIGPGKAQKILEYRNDNGKFGTIEDIMKVSGIKEKFFAKIKDYICV